VPYRSKAEREAASCMTWNQILLHVKQSEQCDEGEARQQIGNAIEDGELSARWADERSRWGTSGPIQMPDDLPPRTAEYWRECQLDRSDNDAIREPPPYDPALVDKHRARWLDEKRRFRKPIFSRHQVLQQWPERRELVTAVAETEATSHLVSLLIDEPNIRRADAWKKLKQKFPKLSQRGFLSRIWVKARQNAGLESKARSGRKPRPKT
jgi:hypothetical protein